MYAGPVGPVATDEKTRTGVMASQSQIDIGRNHWIEPMKRIAVVE